MSSHAVTIAQRDTRHRLALVLMTVFFAAGFVAVMSATVTGQEPKYVEAPIDERFLNERIVKRMKMAARGYATTRNPQEFEDKGAARYFLQQFVPRRITQGDAVSEISELVGQAMSVLGAAERAESPVRDEIYGFIFDGMSRVVRGNFHPPARINAALALGRLNSRPATPDNPPVPDKQVLPILVRLYRNESNVDGLRAAALQGLHRHVLEGANRLSDAERNGIAGLMTALLDAPAPSGRSDAAHAYLQRFAVDILSRLSQPGDPELAKRLVSVSMASDRHELIALYSAARVGRLNGGLNGSVEMPAKVLDGWASRALSSFQSEVARLESLEKPTPAQRQPRKPKDVLAKTEEDSAQGTPGVGDAGYGDMMMEMEGMPESDEGMDMSGYEAMAGQMGEGYPGGMGMPGMPGMMGGEDREDPPQPPEIMLSRRYLSHVLQQLKLGVAGSAESGVPSDPGGLLAAVGEAERPLVTQWVTSLEEVLEAINDTSLSEREMYLERLAEQVALLEELAGEPVRASAEPAAPGEPTVPPQGPAPAAAPRDTVSARPSNAAGGGGAE